MSPSAVLVRAVSALRTAGPPISRLARAARGRHLLAIDLVGVTVAAFLAVALRYDGFGVPGLVTSYLPFIGLLLLIRTLANIRLGLYDRTWRFASVPDLERIVAAVSVGTIVTLFIWLGSSFIGVPWQVDVPHTFWLAEMMFSLATIGGIRFAIRAASDLRPDAATPAHDSHRTLLYGAGRTGALMARSARREPEAGVLPVGFMDDDPHLAGRLVAGLRVYGGLAQLERAVAETGARSLLITMPGAPGPAVRRVVEAAATLDLQVRTVPALTELLDGSIDVHRLRRVKVEDLLGRPIVTEHAAAVEEIIKDRIVLITGAAGSIGSELARQVFAIGPRRLILVDRAESPLYLIQRELEVRREHGQGSGELEFRLANVASRGSMERLISAERPCVIFHAAAYKHVPMMEQHPSDAVQVNIGGTRVLLDAAVAAGVERFVFVSTDKAVRPSSAMGASKRIAEMLVAETAIATGHRYVSVRFGNVLGSTGSVVPIFQEQLENGRPLTITDPAMTRFFMTIPEAAWLILDAAAMGRVGGDLFVLDMGRPVKVLDLARDLVRLAGRDPDTQPIEIVGLRPGEKLHEELFYAAEEVERTASEKVLRAISQPPPPGVRDAVRRILTLANGEDEDRLVDLLKVCANDPETFAANAERRDIGQAVGPGRGPSASRTTPVLPANSSTGEDGSIALGERR
ncbi:MAG TPA: nucleoside-diphosphate sugar epimerase/dehydratase [Candidatus Limnocylindrales bacterium]